MGPQKRTDNDQPVAYDKDGNPLYSHPPSVQQVNPPEPVPHPVTVVPHSDIPVSEEDEKRHEESVARFHDLDLSKGEYVVAEIPRHSIGILGPPLLGGLVALLIIAGVISYPILVPGNVPPFSSIVLPALLLLVLIAIFVYIPMWVYKQNRLYLTNESVVLNVQLSLFSRDQKIVSLGSVEDISFKQTGIFPLMLGYGTLRLSTIGEDNYNFSFAVDPQKHTQLINNTIEEFKNKRKVSWS